MTLAGVRDAPVGWGDNTELTALETMMWRADPIVRSPVLALELLERVPDWDRLVEVHERTVAALPRLRQRVVEPPLGLGTPHWGADPSFELRRHLRRVRLADGEGLGGLLTDVARWALTPFDRGGPPWGATLYDGLPAGGAAYVLKLHHAMTDGLGAAQLLERLHTRTPDRVADPAPVTVPAAEASGLGVLAGQLRRDVDSAAGTLASVRSGAMDAVRDPGGWLASATRYGDSLLRSLAPPEAAGSPLLSGRSATWRFAALDVPAIPLRAAARAGGGTLHDAYLAALLGAYRLYHEAMDAPVESIPMAVPFSLRRPGDPAGGNKIGAARFAGPTGIVDARTRVRVVRELMVAARGRPSMDALELLSPALGRLPGSVLARLMAPVTAGNDLQASFVPGPRGERYLAGARVRRIYPFAPLPGCPAMITMVTHGRDCCVGVNLDPAAITRPDVFLRCLADGFAEVLALQPEPVTPVVLG